MNPRLHHWGLALLFALMAHIALARLLEPPTPIDPSTSGVRIGLGGSGPIEAGSVTAGPLGAESIKAELIQYDRIEALKPVLSPAQTVTPLQTVTQALKAIEVEPPAPVTAVEAKEPTKPKAKTEPVPKRESPAQRTARVAPDPPARPKPKQPQPATARPESAAVDQAKPADKTAGGPSSPQAGPGAAGAGKAGAGGAGGAGGSAQGGKIQDRYYAELAAWLERHKRYPQRARQMRQEGVVRIRFAINRNGRVISHSVEKSSGHSALDAAASELLQRASPMPAIPPGLGHSRLEIVVPIAYRLR